MSTRHVSLFANTPMASMITGIGRSLPGARYPKQTGVSPVYADRVNTQAARNRLAIMIGFFLQDCRMHARLGGRCGEWNRTCFSRVTTVHAVQGSKMVVPSMSFCVQYSLSLFISGCSALAKPRVVSSRSTRAKSPAQPLCQSRRRIVVDSPSVIAWFISI